LAPVPGQGPGQAWEPVPERALVSVLVPEQEPALERAPRSQASPLK